MRRIRIYHPGELSTGLTTILGPNASHHLVHVLRKTVGEQFWIFNGSGGEYEATLVSAGKKTACAEIGAYHECHRESPLKIHLGQSISRGERMDYAIQKASELGVSDITPLFTEFCQVQLSDHRIEKRVAHWQAVAVSAAEQSWRTCVPTVHHPQSFEEWTQRTGDTKIICCLRKDATSFSINLDCREVTVTIGAEGGFSEREISLAISRGFQIMPLGPRVLRTETATVVALTLLQRMGGDLV